MRPRQTTYLVTYNDKLAIGEAYYYCVRDNAADLTKSALKVLLLIDANVIAKSLPFFSRNIPYKNYFSYPTYIMDLNELSDKGYLDRVSLQKYQINHKGSELVKLFWWNHSRLFAKYVKDNKQI